MIKITSHHYGGRYVSPSALYKVVQEEKLWWKSVYVQTKTWRTDELKVKYQKSRSVKHSKQDKKKFPGQSKTEKSNLLFLFYFNPVRAKWHIRACFTQYTHSNISFFQKTLTTQLELCFYHLSLLVSLFRLQHVWELAWRTLTDLKADQPYDPAIPFLKYIPRKWNLPMRKWPVILYL